MLLRRISPVLWSNHHRSFNLARGNKAFWPNGHLKRDATTNTLISYEYFGIWWRLLHNTGYPCICGSSMHRCAARGGGKMNRVRTTLTAALLLGSSAISPILAETPLPASPAAK